MSAPQPPVASDPKSELFALVERGGGATTEAVMLRLLWLRQDHPEAAVSTDVVRADDAHVVMRAHISVPGGAAGSGIAAAGVAGDDDWAEVVERTETMAIARALDTLGYVVRHGGRVERPEAVEGPEPAEQAQPDREPEPAPSEDTSPALQESRETQPFAPRVAESAPPVVNALRRAHRKPEPAPEQMEEEDAPLEEYSWSAFWTRARSLGLTPDRVTEILGRPAAQMTPRDAVLALIKAGAWPGEAGESPS